VGVLNFLFAKMTSQPRNAVDPAHYPYDLDGSLRFTRPRTGVDFWPTHSNRDNFQQLGDVAGLMAQQDALVWAQGYGRAPSGPLVTPLGEWLPSTVTEPANLQWQITIPGLNKQSSA
jgi:hypothetical protein